jgi:hypothetical protein
MPPDCPSLQPALCGAPPDDGGQNVCGQYAPSASVSHSESPSQAETPRAPSPASQPDLGHGSAGRQRAVFCSRYLRWGLQLLGIGHQRSDPGCPWPNGRVERFIGTVKQLLAANMIRDSTHLERTLQDVRTHYNRFRPHQHLDERTPAEAWAGVDVFAPRRQVHTWRMECPHGG